MSDDTPTSTRPQVVSNALAFQKRSGEAFAPQRARELKDLACQVPENLWPDDVKQARGGSTIGGVAVPARPMMSIDKLGQPVKLQMNQMRSAHLGVRIHPLDQKANKETAEIQQGLYRSIEVDSRADVPRLWGADRALKCGTGWYRVNVVYDDATDDPFDLKIRLERILRQSSCFPDPFAQEADFCDQKEFLLVSFLPLASFKRLYPGSKISGFDSSQLTEYQQDAPFWFDGEGESMAVCVAEYYYTEYKDREWVILDDGSFAFADEMPEGRQQTKDSRTRKVKEPVIKWSKVTAAEELESQTWNGKYIPFVPCIGIEVQPFNSDRIWQGIYSTNKDSAHLFNVAVSNAVEVSALEPKAPWIGYVGQFKTNNKQWQLANVRNLPYLEADPVMVNGQVAPLPQRTQSGANLGPSIALIEIADQNLQAGTSMYDQSLGKGDRDDSGKKVLALQDQGLASNSHWLANLAEISMPYESKVVLDLMPKVYDRPGRSVYVTGEDGEQTEVILNQPFTIDPQTERPVPIPDWVEGQPLPKGAKFYDLRNGKYGSVVSIGKRYETRAQQGADAFSQLLMAQPDLIKFVGDIWMGFQDFPGHELAAKRLKAAIPPEIANADKDESDGPDPQVMAQKLQVAEQGAQMMQKIIEEQGKAIETEQIKHQADLQRVELEQTGKVQIESVKSQLAIALQKMKDDQVLSLERLKQAQANLDREDKQKHELAMAAADAALVNSDREDTQRHETALKSAEAAHAADAATISHQQGMEAAEAQSDVEGAGV